MRIPCVCGKQLSAVVAQKITFSLETSLQREGQRPANLSKRDVLSTLAFVQGCGLPFDTAADELLSPLPDLSFFNERPPGCCDLSSDELISVCSELSFRSDS